MTKLDISSVANASLPAVPYGRKHIITKALEQLDLCLTLINDTLTVFNSTNTVIVITNNNMPTTK